MDWGMFTQSFSLSHKQRLCMSGLVATGNNEREVKRRAPVTGMRDNVGVVMIKKCWLWGGANGV